MATFTYDAGKLASIDSLGRTVELSYDGDDLEVIILPDGSERVFTYDDHRVTSDDRGSQHNAWTYSDGLADSLTRGDAEPMILAPALGRGLDTLTKGDPWAGLTDPLGHPLQATFDDAGRPLSSLSAVGGMTQISRDGDGFVTGKTDPLGRSTGLTPDAFGFITQVTNPDSTTRTYEYQDDFHALTTITDERGQTTVNTYNGQGQLIRVTDAQGNIASYTYENGLIKTVTDPLLNTLTYDYDEFGRVKTVTDPGGGVMTFSYDAAGNVRTVTDPLNQTTTYSHDGLGRVTGVEQPGGGLWTTVYDAAGRVTASVDPLGRHSALYEYDARGLLTRSVSAAGTAEEQSVLYEYDDAGRPVAVRDAQGNWDQFEYDAAGQMLSSVDARGNRQANVYDLAGQLVASRDELGRQTSYVYDDRGLLLKSIDALGGVTSYLYDEAGNLVGVTDPLGHTATTVYDELGRAVATITPLGFRTTLAYDDAGRLASVTDPRAVQTQFAYDERDRPVLTIQAYGTGLERTLTNTYDDAGNLLTSTDALGHTYTYGYDSLNRPVTTTDPLGHTAATVYDDVGNVLSVTDANSRTVTFGYDALDRLISVTDPLGQTHTTVYDAQGRVVANIDPLGHVQQAGYDALGRLVVQIDGTGGVTRFGYDDAGRLVRVIDPLGHETTREYDVLGRLVRQIDALGQVGTFAYDAAGNLVTSTDPLGRVVTFGYDAMNRQETVERSLVGVATSVYDAASLLVASVNPLGFRTTFVYDELGRQVATVDALLGRATSVYDAADRLEASVDPLGNRTTFVYDAADRRTVTIDALNQRVTAVYDNVDLIATVDARGGRTTFTYDDAGRMVQREDALNGLSTTVFDAAGRVAATVDARGDRTTMSYDAAGRLTAVEDALGRVRGTDYDAAGNAVRQLDALGQATTFVYDALNRVVGVTRPHGGTATTVYDAAGQVRVRVDELGQRTTLGYDAAGRQVTVQDALNGVTTSVYDAADRRTVLVDPVGNRTTFVYDALDRVIEEIDPLHHSLTMAYDAASRLASRTDRLGRRIDFVYDALGAKTGETWLAANGTTVLDRVTFTYDAAGNMLTAVNGAAAYTFSYDALQRQKTQTGPFGTLLTFSYDAVGHRTKVEDQFGGVLSSVYDAAGQLTSRRLGGRGGRRIDLDYTDRGELESLTRYSDLAGSTKVGESAYAYDAAGRLTHLQHTNGSSSNIANYTYTYDAADRVTSEVLNGGSPVSYSYDATNQVTGDGTNSFSFDANGNRNMSGYATTTGNRMSNDGTYTYTYDVQGNLTKKSKGAAAETWTYGYDNKDQLLWVEKRATDGGTLQMRTDYTYDAFSRRIAKAVDADGAGAGGTTVERFIYVDQDVWAELDGSNALVTRRIVGDQINQLWAKVNGATITHILTDRLGSVRDLANNSGTVLDHLDYDPFGKIVYESTPANADGTGYAGGRRNVETGNAYFIHRYYDPATGKWLTVDPLSFDAGDTNLYRYVFNNATNRTDPLGLFDEVLFWENVEKLTPGAGLKKWFQTEQNGKIIQRDWGLFTWNYWTTYIDGGSTTAVYLWNGYNEIEAAEIFVKQVTEDSCLAGVWKRRNIDVDPVGAHADWAPWATKQIARAGLNGYAVVTAFYTIQLRGLDWAITFTNLTEGEVDLFLVIAIARVLPLSKLGKIKVFGKGGKPITEIENATVRTAPKGVGAGGGGSRAPGGRTSLPTVKNGPGVGAGPPGRVGTVTGKRIMCFPPGTLVLMADGTTKAIEDVRPGDQILADDPQDGDAPSAQAVVAVLKNFTYNLVHLSFDADGDGNSDGILEATREHPIWTQERGWQNAVDIRAGDALQDRDGRAIRVLSAWVETTDVDTFNLSVAELHTFFVVVNGTAILVHNTDPWDIMFSHPLSSEQIGGTFTHGPWAGRTLDDAINEARRLGRLPDGLVIEAGEVVLPNGDRRIVAVDNRTLYVAQQANLRNVTTVNNGGETHKLLTRNFKNSGLGGPIETPC